MDVLPDLLADDLRLVIAATVVGECSARRGHYYAGPGQSFYPLLAGAGLTPQVLDPRDDGLLPELGVGLTDVVALHSDGQVLGFDVPSFAAKIGRHRPAWVAFNGKEAARVCARWAGRRAPGLGPQGWTFAGAQVYVLPSSSGANRRRNYDGRPDRASWWDELGALVRAR